MKSITVDLGSRSYPIHIGACLSDSALLMQTMPHKEIVFVTNETVAPLYLEQLMRVFDGTDRKLASVILPDGEKYKTLDTVNKIFDVLLEHSFSRKVLLVALGGGVIGDMTGFAAASYQRGVDFVQIPTTLLSQVDSSVGGKTGVNHPLGKNMIGAFKQPIAVLIDPSTLKTLPKEEFSAGYAEVIKHGIIQDVEYLEMLECNHDSIFALDDKALTDVIAGSCRVKSGVVAQDETEQGIRAILNLGHTFGHAVETTLGYGEWLHGEAVGLGMLMAADLSARMGLISESDVERVRTIVAKSGLPTEAPAGMTAEQFLVAMGRDKKVDAGTLRLVLIRAIGDAYVTADFDHTLLEETLSEFCHN